MGGSLKGVEGEGARNVCIKICYVCTCVHLSLNTFGLQQKLVMHCWWCQHPRTLNNLLVYKLYIVFRNAVERHANNSLFLFFGRPTDCRVAELKGSSCSRFALVAIFFLVAVNILYFLESWFARAIKCTFLLYSNISFDISLLMIGISLETCHVIAFALSHCKFHSL